MRLRARPILAVLAAATALIAVTPASGATVSYAVGKHLCTAPRPGTLSCMAVRRVIVSKQTSGAMPFVRGDGATANGTIGPQGGLTPSDLASAYGFASAAATSMKVGIVDAYNDPNINADLQTFDTHYGLATCSIANLCLKVVNQSGATSPLPIADGGWAGEIALDVEAVHSVCQNCKIILVEANSSSNADLATAENRAVTLGANVVTNSFGGAEGSSISSTDAAAYNHSGVVITASTGDDGWYDWDHLAAQNQPDLPASYPTVVAVGGTSLYLNQAGGRQAESVWNDNGIKGWMLVSLGSALGATGGGCSTLTTAKGWQTALTTWASTGCGTHRLAADVSAVADYITGFDTYNSYLCATVPNCWGTIGGTSLASPVVAALWALAGGAHGAPNPGVFLYGHPASAAYDVTVGGNGFCDGMGAAGCGIDPTHLNPNVYLGQLIDCSFPATGTTPSAGNRACDALPGYDGPSGVGAPVGLTLFGKVGPAGTVTAPVTITHAVSGSYSMTGVTDPFPGGLVTSYKFHWGDGTADTTSATVPVAHTYAAAGAYTITVTPTDNYSITGTATKGITVG